MFRTEHTAPANIFLSKPLPIFDLLPAPSVSFGQMLKLNLNLLNKF